MVTVSGFSLSRQELNACVRNVEPCFHPSPCLCRSDMTDCVTSVVWSSVPKSRSVVKCFLGVRRSGSIAVLLVSPSGKVLRLFASIHTSSVGVVLLVTSHRCPLCKFCQEHVCVSRSVVQESAHSVCDIVSDTSGELSPSCVCCL